MIFLYLKALHIIFIVTWFSGLFYIVRLFIYFVEAESEIAVAKEILQKQYKIMAQRLWYIITWPSAIITLGLAASLLYHEPGFLLQPYMHIKLALVAGLYIYHFSCHKIYLQMQRGKIMQKSFHLRLWNELATLLLFAVVFLVVLKNALSWIWSIAALFLFGTTLFMLAKWYKKWREK